jgi:hypothetical protein
MQTESQETAWNDFNRNPSFSSQDFGQRARGSQQSGNLEANENWQQSAE